MHCKGRFDRVQQGCEGRVLPELIQGPIFTVSCHQKRRLHGQDHQHAPGA